MRHFFEVDRYFVVIASLSALVQDNVISADIVTKALKKFNIDPEKIDPSIS
ncbi:MAG: pyruvate dehydrogenase E1 component [Flavobacterium sp.]